MSYTSFTSPNSNGVTLLKCVDLTYHLLTRLDAGSRSQVKLSTMKEVRNGFSIIRNLLPDEKSVMLSLSDIFGAVDIIEKSNVQYLTADMKETIVEGINTFKTNLCCNAYNYYLDHDVPVNNNTKAVLTDVVKIALNEGLLKP